MSLRIYFDEDAQDAELVRILRARGLDISTVNEEGMQGRTDEEQLILATSKGRTLFTFSIADFGRLHARWMAAGRSHGGIVVAEQRRYPVGEKSKRIVHLAGSLTQEQMLNRFEFLSNW